MRFRFPFEPPGSRCINRRGGSGGSTSEQVHIDSIEEEILDRVASIDVGKDSGMVCTRVLHPSKAGKRTSTVWSWSERTRTILELGDRLVAEGIERVVLEATSDYWRPFYYLLEARGLHMWLVNARDVKKRLLHR